MPGFLDSLLARGETVDYAALCCCASQGDAVATSPLHRATTLRGVLCVNMLRAFDLDRIVIGGSLMASAQALLPPLRE